MGRKHKKNTIPDGPCEPFCEHFELCGGCTYQRFSYEGQKEEKLAKVKKLMDEVYPEFPLTECLSSPIEREYRNKMEFSFGDMQKDGELTLGLHQRGSFFNILPITNCQIVDDDYRTVIKKTLDFFRKKDLPYVHKKTHEGVLRHLLMRKSQTTGEMLIGLVTSSQGICFNDEASGDILSLDEARWEPEWIAEYRDMLLSSVYDGKIAGILHMINDSMADVVKADKMVLLYGRDYIVDEILGLSFKITPFSFFQTNTTGAGVLYNVVREYIGDTSGMTVYDLYSGTGTIAQLLAPVAKRVIGVEIVEEAVGAAVENAKINGLNNCEFISGDVLDVMDKITDLPDVMVLDPPREGIHPKVLPKLLSYGVENFVYVSCKPESLARDMAEIVRAGYRPVRAVCVDMFPWTKHIEVVTLFSFRASV